MNNNPKLDNFSFNVLSNLTNLNLEGSQLIEFQNNNLDSLKYLTIRGSLTEFKNNNLSSVTLLDLTGNNIRTIVNLSTYKKLQILFLTGNAFPIFSG